MVLREFPGDASLPCSINPPNRVPSPRILGESADASAQSADNQQQCHRRFCNVSYGINSCRGRSAALIAWWTIAGEQSLPKSSSFALLASGVGETHISDVNEPDRSSLCFYAAFFWSVFCRGGRNFRPKRGRKRRAKLATNKSYSNVLIGCCIQKGLRFPGVRLWD